MKRDTYIVSESNIKNKNTFYNCLMRITAHFFLVYFHICLAYKFTKRLQLIKVNNNNKKKRQTSIPFSPRHLIHLHRRSIPHSLSTPPPPRSQILCQTPSPCFRVVTLENGWFSLSILIKKTKNSGIWTDYKVYKK